VKNREMRQVRNTLVKEIEKLAPPYNVQSALHIPECASTIGLVVTKVPRISAEGRPMSACQEQCAISSAHFPHEGYSIRGLVEDTSVPLEEK
jgi:hypothetical protein